ncbi:hypothetical protein [Nitrospira tepida]|uniref:hypothetical protein n=1 Tax=Nitrospira tepida TaxID=2973512 RepID=UPI00259CC257|nr:hypothetical protein [Nitrospira tepida]
MCAKRKPVPPDPITAATGFLKGECSLTKDLRCEHQNEARRKSGADPPAKRLAGASRKVRKESMRVNAGFAAIEHEPDA